MLKLHTLFAFFVFISPTLYAKDSQSSSQYLKNEKTAPGYTILAKDYLGVRQKMRQGIQEGKAQEWGAWLRPGLQNNYTLYNWLLSDWYWQQGYKEKAYSAAVRAFMMSKTEVKICNLDNKSTKQVLDSLLYWHKETSSYKPTQDLVRTSIFQAGESLEDIILRKKSLSGHTCFLSKGIQGTLTGNLAFLSYEGSFQTFAAALKEVKKEMQYEKILETNSISQSMMRDSLRQSVQKEANKDNIQKTREEYLRQKQKEQ